MMQPSALWKRLARPAAAALLVLAVGPGARADQYLDAANMAAAATPGTHPAEDALFPALAAMQAPPLEVGLDRDSLRELLLLTPSDARWAEVEHWAMREPQRKALEALHSIADPKKQHIVGIPYGKTGVKPEWVEAGLYVDLGPDDLLFGARFRYHERLSWLVALSAFEGARLAATEKKGEEALFALLDLGRLGRILGERAFADEMAAGMSIIFIASERIRDIVHTYPDAFTSASLTKVTAELDERAMRLTVITLPEADRLAAEQIVARTFDERGGARPGDLASVMSRAQIGDRPLRLFSVAAWWASLAPTHADWFDTTDQIAAVWGDYSLRWTLSDFNDRQLRRPSDFRRMNPASFPVVFMAMEGIEPLFSMRKNLIADIGATYDGLGVAAFKLKEKNFPPQIAAIEPKYVKTRFRDIYNVDRRFVPTVIEDYPYWVPIRDQTFDRREGPHPYRVAVTLTNAPPATLAVEIPDVPEDVAWTDQLVRDWVVSYSGFDDFPADVQERMGATVDVEASSVKADALKEIAVEAIAKREYSNRDVSQFALSIGLLDSLRQAPDMREAVSNILNSGVLPIYPRLTQSGVDLSGYIDLIVDSTKLVIERPEFGATVTKAASGKVGVEDLRAWATVSAEAEITQELLDRAMTVMKEWGPRAVTMYVAFEKAQEKQVETAAPTAFSATLDETVFLLYSVGPDGKDDRAAVVGPAGVNAPDMLFWPPIIALERKFN